MPLVRRVGLAVPPAAAAGEYARARLRIAEAGLAYVEELDALETTPPVVVEQVRRSLQNRVNLARETPEDRAGMRQTYRQVWREVVAVQGRELAQLYAAGAIGDATRRRLQRQLDLEEARFSEDH